MKKTIGLALLSMLLAACSNQTTPAVSGLEKNNDQIVASDLQADPSVVSVAPKKDKLFTVAAARDCGFPPNSKNAGKSFTQLAKEVEDYAASIGTSYDGTVRQLRYAATPEASEEFKTALAECAGMS